MKTTLSILAILTEVLGVSFVGTAFGRLASCDCTGPDRCEMNRPSQKPPFRLLTIGTTLVIVGAAVRYIIRMI